MRKSFDGLSGLVRNELNTNPLSGEVFVFFNRRRTMVKLLQWDLTGFIIFSKRLEAGTFGNLSDGADGVSVTVKRDELLLVLEGIELKNIKRRKRYLLNPQHWKNQVKHPVFIPKICGLVYL